MIPHHSTFFSRRTVLTRTAALPVLAGAAHWFPAWAHDATPVGTAATPDPSIPQLVAGNTAFAFELYAELRDTGAGNVLVSPFSISLALAMIGAGARAETATQMAETLHLDLEQPALHAAFSTLIADLIGRGNAEPGGATGLDAQRLHIANALWVEQTYPLLPAYTSLLERYYGSALHQADFVHHPEESREEINTWVEDQTEDRIRDVVPAGAIDRATKQVLANAIYFYGSWQSAFDPKDTSNDAFHRLDSTTVTVPLMYQVADLPYVQGDGYQVVELSYAESGFALTIILPDDGRFAEVEAALDSDMLELAIEQLAEAEVHVYLPKFELETDTVELEQPLQALGMVDAFDPNRADFTGAAEGGLFITHALHKAFISVDEEGTEAAAATVISSGSPTAMPRLEVRCDRPFIFAIRDREAGTLLFLGRVLDSSA